MAIVKTCSSHNRKGRKDATKAVDIGLVYGYQEARGLEGLMVLSKLGYRLLMQDEADLFLNTNGKSIIAASLGDVCKAIGSRVSNHTSHVSQVRVLSLLRDNLGWRTVSIVRLGDG